MNQKERDDLHTAFLDTNYVVVDEEIRVVIRVGETSDSLERFLARKRITEWAFITAFNPYSQQLSETENEKRQMKMRGILQSESFSFLSGFGEAANGEWPPEPSLFIFDLKEVRAIEIAQDFEQNAIVCGRIGEAAELVWCR